MRIRFLGTSAGWPLPRLGCTCETCTSKDPKDKRLRPSVLVNDSVLIDAGPDIYHQIINHKQSLLLRNKSSIINLKALILTHAHYDHILGFHDLTHIYNLKTKPFLFTTQETFNGLRQFHRLPLDPFISKIVPSEESFLIDNTKFTFIPVEHGNTPTSGIKIKEGKLIVYLPDFNHLLPSQEKTCRDVHLLILDGSSLDKVGQTKNHESIVEGINLGKKLKAKQIYFTHLGHKTGKHKELELFVQKEGGKNFHIAYDNLKIDL